VTLVIALLLCGAAPVWAQAPKVFRVGILTMAYTPWHSHTEGFRDGLKDLGFVEGRNLAFEARAARGDANHIPDLVAEIVRQKPDLLYCVGSVAAQACPKATATIPIVLAEVGDPVGLGLVKSLGRPGGNVTGMANLRAELTAKRVELFKETVPGLRRVLVTYDPRQAEEQEALRHARSAAGRLGLTLLERPITAPLEIEPGLAELREGGRDGLLIVQSGVNLNVPGRSLEVATSNKLPTMFPASFWTKFGALASYGPDQHLQGR